VSWSALRGRPGTLARLGGWSVAEALPTLLAGYLTARAVDDGFLAGRPGAGLAWLGGLAAAVLVGAVGTARAYACLGDLVEPFRDSLARRVVGGALHHATSPGGPPQTAAVARLTHQVEIVRDTFAGLVMVVRGFVFTAGAALLGLLSLAPVLAALVAGPLLVGLALFAAALPAMAARQRDYVLADERLGEAAGAALAGHRDIVACGGQAPVEATVGARIDAQAIAERSLARMAAVRGLTLAVGGWLPLVVLLLAAPWLVRRGLTAGAVLGALVYLSTGLQPALHALVKGVAVGGLRYAVTLRRILRASAHPPADTPPPPVTEPSPVTEPDTAAAESVDGRPSAVSPPAVWSPVRSSPAGSAPGDGLDGGPAVAVRGLTFRYGSAARPVLDGFDLTLPAGDHLAIVGPSGAGKSTLAALIAGLLVPDAGSVRLAGRPVRAGGTEQAGTTERAGDVGLAGQRVLIPQQAYVFSGRLAENLRYLNPTAGAAELTAAIDALGMTALARRLGGLDAPVDPAALSAGERQLISAVRAYLSPAPLVILDEATCHLDPAAEARVERVFARRPGTLIVVAHRISSALRARRVLVIDGGPPALGRHDELLDRSPTYRDLVGHWQGGPGAGGQIQPASRAIRTDSIRVRAPHLPAIRDR
jgi:ATP-binding cassette subfamily C protein